MTIDISTREARQVILNGSWAMGDDGRLLYAREAMGAAFDRIDELERLIGQRPKNDTMLPDWAQNLWESCVLLSEKAAFKAMWQHGHHVEQEHEQLQTLARDLAASLDLLNNGTNHWCDSASKCGKCGAEESLDRARAAGVLL